jgi:hypothetical protein
VGGLDLPEQHIVIGGSGGVGAASVLQEVVISILLQGFLGTSDTIVEILLICFVRVMLRITFLRHMNLNYGA